MRAWSGPLLLPGSQSQSMQRGIGTCELPRGGEVESRSIKTDTIKETTPTEETRVEMLILTRSFTSPGDSRQHTLSTQLSSFFHQHEAVIRITPGCCLVYNSHKSAFAS